MYIIYKIMHMQHAYIIAWVALNWCEKYTPYNKSYPFFAEPEQLLFIVQRPPSGAEPEQRGKEMRGQFLK